MDIAQEAPDTVVLTEDEAIPKSANVLILSLHVQFEIGSLELLHLLPCGVSHRVPSQSLLAGLEELLSPRVERVGLDPFASAEFVDRDLAAKTFEDDSDLLLRTLYPSRC